MDPSNTRKYQEVKKQIELEKVAEMVRQAREDEKKREEVKLLKATIKTLGNEAEEYVACKHFPNRQELLLINNKIISMLSDIKDILAAIEDIYYCQG
jgi:altronate dehydratase